MSDFKSKLQNWQNQQPTPSKEVPVKKPPPPKNSPAPQPQKKTLEAQETQELDPNDRLLFLETVVQMGGAEAKPQIQNQNQEYEAAQTVQELHASERELFQKEALEFGMEDVKAHKTLEHQAIHARPQLARRILRGLEEPSVTCDLHGLDREQASGKVHIALSQCHQFDRQVLLIIHGKGQGLLREQVIADLNANIWVAEHFVAPAHLGGEGARVIILKKKERRK